MPRSESDISIVTGEDARRACTALYLKRVHHTIKDSNHHYWLALRRVSAKEEHYERGYFPHSGKRAYMEDLKKTYASACFIYLLLGTGIIY